MKFFQLPFSRRRARVDARDDICLHIEGRIDDLMARGMARADARRPRLTAYECTPPF
jgi:hypothetical protein